VYSREQLAASAGGSVAAQGGTLSDKAVGYLYQLFPQLAHVDPATAQATSFPSLPLSWQVRSVPHLSHAAWANFQDQISEHKHHAFTQI